MKGLSDHTLLMNQMIGLCIKTYDYPSPLKNLGYSVEWIEPRLVNSEGKKVNPDLMFTSNRLVHVLITDCKGGKNVDEHRKEEIDNQVERYSKITTDSIVPKVTVYDPNRLTFDIFFATNVELAEYLKDYNIPVIIFSDEYIIKKNKFQEKKLEEAFLSRIIVSGKPPTHFYPFSDQDERSVIALYVFQKLVVLSLRSRGEFVEFDADTILKEIYRQFWDVVDESKKKNLRNKVDDILFEYQKRKELKEYLEKVKRRRSWRITKSLDAFRKSCQEIIEELEKQQKLDYFKGG